MAQPAETLLYVARLQSAEAAVIMALDAAFPRSGVRAQLLTAVEEVCLDRLVRAEGCLALSRSLLQTAAGGVAGEEQLRAAVGRAYYSIHHSIRVMALWQNKWDPDGHEESIKELKKMLSDNSFRHRSGLAPDVWEWITEARDNRHVADYSPYSQQRHPQAHGIDRITGDNWMQAATFNTELAEEIYAAAYRFLGL